MRACVALIFVCLLFISGRVGASNLPELAERTKPSVVLLTVLDGAGTKLGTGTGFFVSTSGRVVTNFHVVDGAANILATASDGREIAIVGLLASDPSRDLAVLQVEAGAYPPLTLGDSSVVRPGDEVVVIGSPLGLSGTVSAGIVSAVREKGMPDSTAKKGPARADDLSTLAWGIQITAAISPGSSGSPIMTPTGEVIAVAVGTRLDGQSVNFAIPSAAVAELLASIGDNATPRPLSALERGDVGGRPVWMNLAISAGALAAVALLWAIVSRVLAASARRSARSSPKRR
jgi:S1-C subfamily serine protease